MPSTRLMNLLVYAALTVLSLVVIRSVSGLPVTMPGDVGTHFFPTALSWAIIGLCALGAVRAVLAGPGETFRVDYLARIVLTILLMAGFFLSWKNFGAFYPQAFAFLFILFTYYRWPLGVSARMLAINAAVALCISVFCYFVFNFLIYVDL